MYKRQLINNAGISHIGLLSDMTPEEWNNIVAINLTGVFNFTKLVIPYTVSYTHLDVYKRQTVAKAYCLSKEHHSEETEDD